MVVCVLDELPAFYHIQIFNTVFTKPTTGSLLHSGSADTFKTHLNTILLSKSRLPKCYNVFTHPFLNEACISCACRTFHKLRYLIALATFSKQNHEAPIIQFSSPPIQWRTEGGGGGAVWGGSNSPPRNSEGPPKSCQTQPDCENC
jgi:hypothetical protein